jgi:hypothetical protein
MDSVNAKSLEMCVQTFRVPFHHFTIFCLVTIGLPSFKRSDTTFVALDYLGDY